MQWQRIVLLIGVAVIILFAVIGSLFTPPHCYKISECEKCWTPTETYGKSEYCPSGAACKQIPYIDQHNALVDVLNCACEKASESQYSDYELNNNIVSLFRTLTGISSDTQEICRADNPLLVKWFYE